MAENERVAGTEELREGVALDLDKTGDINVNLGPYKGLKFSSPYPGTWTVDMDATQRLVVSFEPETEDDPDEDEDGDKRVVLSEEVLGPFTLRDIAEARSSHGGGLSALLKKLRPSASRSNMDDVLDSMFGGGSIFGGERKSRSSDLLGLLGLLELIQAKKGLVCIYVRNGPDDYKHVGDIAPNASLEDVLKAAGIKVDDDAYEPPRKIKHKTAGDIVWLIAKKGSQASDEEDVRGDGDAS